MKIMVVAWNFCCNFTFVLLLINTNVWDNGAKSHHTRHQSGLRENNKLDWERKRKIEEKLCCKKSIFHAAFSISFSLGPKIYPMSRKSASITSWLWTANTSLSGTSREDGRGYPSKAHRIFDWMHKEEKERKRLEESHPASLLLAHRFLQSSSSENVSSSWTCPIFNCHVLGDNSGDLFPICPEWQKRRGKSMPNRPRPYWNHGAQLNWWFEV